MDYQVFTLSRIRENWEATHDPVESVAVGIQQSGRIISSAAVLFVVVVGGFILSNITFMMMIGVGLVIAVVVDATIVRGLLVPATMRLLGDRAWWAPAPLARWWRRWGVPESHGGPPVPPLGSEPAPGAQPSRHRLDSEPVRASAE
jgi:RND superfamily putative drug exporter